MIFDDNTKKGAFLAPMAGFTDFAFRSICSEYGALSGVTEMVSAKAIDFKNKKTEVLYFNKPLTMKQGIQLFGNDPNIVARVIRDVVNDLDFDYIDFNMACPVPKIFKNKEGSYLMSDPILAYNIVSNMVKFSLKPIGVKIRLGISVSNINASEFAKVLEDAGASFITVHGRTRDMYYSGKAMIDELAKVKQAVSIPVIANGDVVIPEDAKRILEISGCDAVMIGRGALGRPWIFKQVREYFETGFYSFEPDISEKVKIIFKQYNLMKEYKKEKLALLEMRKHCARYLKGIKGASLAKDLINKAESEDEFFEILNNIKEDC